jgi:hypothetical protein
MVRLPKHGAGAADGLKEDALLVIRGNLTIQPQSTSDIGEARGPLKLYREDDEAIYVPRMWYARNKTAPHQEILEVSRGEALSAECIAGGFRGSDQAPYEEQPRAIDQILVKMGQYSKVREGHLPAECQGLEDKPWGGSILKASCAFGKTASSLRAIYRLGRTALVVVNKEFFMKQWKEEIQTFLPGAKIGKIQGPVCDYKGKDIVIGMIHSLSQRQYPEEVYSYFGTVVVDEAHRTGSDTFSIVVPKFSAAYRLALTATPRRKDGCERAFLDNFGEIGYAAKTESRRPIVKFVNAGEIPFFRKWGKWIDPENANSAEVDNIIAQNEHHNRSCVAEALKAAALGRKVMLLSTRIEQLTLFWGYLQEEKEWATKALEQGDASRRWLSQITVGWATGQRPEFDPDTKQPIYKEETLKKRAVTEQELEVFNNCQIILSTKQMIEEGYNNQSLDTMILCMPFSDVEQMVGRIRRHCPPTKKCGERCPWRAGTCTGKPDPVVVDMVQTNTRFMRKAVRRIEFYNSIGARQSLPQDGSLSELARYVKRPPVVRSGG